MLESTKEGATGLPEGSDIGLGAGGPGFESPHSDHLSQKNRLKRRFFCVFCSVFAVWAIAVQRWFQGQKSGGSMNGENRRNRQIPNPSLIGTAAVFFILLRIRQVLEFSSLIHYNNSTVSLWPPRQPYGIPYGLFFQSRIYYVLKRQY